MNICICFVTTQWLSLPVHPDLIYLIIMSFLCDLRLFGRFFNKLRVIALTLLEVGD